MAAEKVNLVSLGDSIATGTLTPFSRTYSYVFYLQRKFRDNGYQPSIYSLFQLQQQESTNLPLLKIQLAEAERGIENMRNAIYLYDDKIVLTFNYKDGTKIITAEETNSSDLTSSGRPSAGHMIKGKNTFIMRLFYRLF